MRESQGPREQLRYLPLESELLDRACEHDEGRQRRTIRPVTPYPGSPLFYTAIEKGLVNDARDFYEVKHLNSDLLAVNFTALTDQEFHNALLWANKVLLEDFHKKQLNFEVEQQRGCITTSIPISRAISRKLRLFPRTPARRSCLAAMTICTHRLLDGLARLDHADARCTGSYPLFGNAPPTSRSVIAPETVGLTSAILTNIAMPTRT